MKNKYVFVTALLLVIAFAGFGFVQGYTYMEQQKVEDGLEHRDKKEAGTASCQDEEFRIVTSFYPMYVAALNVAGACEGVRVENLSEPKTGCLHDYQLTPQDMILLAEADVFVINGGGMEGFLADVTAEYPGLEIVNATDGIFDEEASDETEVHEEVKAKAHEGHNHGENAHVWLSIPHYMEQIKEIRDGLMAADAIHADIYRENAEEYLAQIADLQQEAVKLQQAAGQEIVIFHEAFALVAEDYGMRVAGELNLDEERQISAGEVADLLSVINEKKIEIILAEDLYGRDMGDTIEKETGCEVIYLNTLVQGDGSKDSWLRGMRQNIELLKEAIGK